jgi:anaerobic selenocysteine-containing dehydrogenase
METVMVEKSSMNPGRVSRRDFLFAAGVAGGAAAAVALSASPAAASNKMSQKAMSYRPSPNGNQRCDNCGNFQAPSSCKLVDGVVAPNGWCVLYRPK